MKKRWSKIVQNTYFLLGFSFLVWMLFFDSADLLTQYQLWRKLKELEQEKVYYSAKIEELKKDSEKLMASELFLEKVAREKYYMKKPTEDVYIVVE